MHAYNGMTFRDYETASQDLFLPVFVHFFSFCMSLISYQLFKVECSNQMYALSLASCVVGLRAILLRTISILLYYTCIPDRRRLPVTSTSSLLQFVGGPCYTLPILLEQSGKIIAIFMSVFLPLLLLSQKFKFGLQVDKCRLYLLTEIQHSRIYVLFLSIVFMSQISQQLFKIECSNVVYRFIMTYCIALTRASFISLILFKNLSFVLSLYSLINKTCVRDFSATFQGSEIKFPVQIDGHLLHCGIANQYNRIYFTLYFVYFCP